MTIANSNQVVIEINQPRKLTKEEMHEISAQFHRQIANLEQNTWLPGDQINITLTIHIR